MSIIQFLSAFGLGAVVTALIQAWLSHKSYIAKRNFEEKKEAYIGLLEAYHRAAVENTETAAKNFAYWKLRCDLVATKDIRDAAQDMIDTNDNATGRSEAIKKLKNAMRNDLGVNITD